RPGSAGADAREHHRLGVPVHPAGPATGGRRGSRRAFGAGQGVLHGADAGIRRLRTRAARRQRHPAGAAGWEGRGGRRGDLLLRGHPRDQHARRRPGHHRPQRVRLSPGTSLATRAWGQQGRWCRVAANKTAYPRAPWLARRLFPVLATVGLVAVGMAATIWWGPMLEGQGAWTLPHDLWR